MLPWRGTQPDIKSMITQHSLQHVNKPNNMHCEPLVNNVVKAGMSICNWGRIS